MPQKKSAKKIGIRNRHISSNIVDTNSLSFDDWTRLEANEKIECS
jgi:hypothetical protein